MSTDLNCSEVVRQRVIGPTGVNRANAIWKGQADSVPADCWSGASNTRRHLA